MTTIAPGADAPPPAADGRSAGGEGFFRALVERCGEVVVALDADGSVLYANSAVVRVLGYEPDAWRSVRDVFALVHPDDVERVLADFQAKVADGTAGRPITFRFRHGVEGWRHLEAVGANLLDDPAVGALVVNLRDVTERVEETERRRRDEARYRRALDASPEAIAIHQDGVVVFANPAAAEVLGAADPAEIVGRSVFEFVPPQTAEIIAERMARLRAGEEVGLIEEELRRLDGSIVEVEIAGVPVEWDGRPAAQLVARDLTERRKAQAQLERQATHDALTGLPNRLVLAARLADAEARRARTGRPYAVAFLDLDGLKVVNDGLGHAAGDELLCHVARRLHDAARDDDLVARFGGDEFVVVLEDLDAEHESDLDALLDRFLAAIEAPLTVGRHEVRVRASGGVVLVDGPVDGRDILSEADAAMYLAKRRGRGRFERFGPEMRAAAARRLHLEAELRHAIDAGELRPVFQPEVDLATGDAIGMEALVRWTRPGRRELGPAAFLDVAEEAGLVDGVGDAVRRRALAQLADWQAAGGSTVSWVSVNVAAPELLHPRFAERVGADLDRAGLPGAALCLEITESSIVADPERAVAVVGALRERGVAFAIDDFGTGYASLGYLRRFSPEFVKIDRTFVARMLADAGELSIVRGAIDMAHAFGARAIAEGVETAEQHQLLADLGCDLGQGFLYARPAWPDELG